LGCLAQAVVGVQQVLHFRAGEVGIQHQARLATEKLFVASVFELLADRRANAALPNDGIAHGPTRLATPDHRRLALIGDADRRHLLDRAIGGCQCLLGHGELRLPDLFRIVFHHAGAGKYLAELALGRGGDPSPMVEENRPTGRGPLVEREDVVRHGKTP